MRAGAPDAAARLAADRLGHAGRALEYAVAADPTFLERYDEIGLRRLVNDAAVLLDAVAVSVASADPTHAEHWADTSVAPYRRRRIPMDDLVTLAAALRRSIAGSLAAEELVHADEAITLAADVWQRARRLGGDARKRNRILSAIYKGA